MRVKNRTLTFGHKWQTSADYGTQRPRNTRKQGSDAANRSILASKSPSGWGVRSYDRISNSRSRPGPRWREPVSGLALLDHMKVLLRFGQLFAQALDGVAHSEVLSLLLWRMFSIWQICWEVKERRAGQGKAARRVSVRGVSFRWSYRCDQQDLRVNSSCYGHDSLFRVSAKSQQPPWLLPRQGRVALSVPEL